MHCLYLHGFGSSPQSAKAQALKTLLGATARSYQVPALEGGDFRSHTIDRALGIAEAAARALPDDGVPLLVLGSSLGGYLAALLAAQGRLSRLAGLVLIAPAFRFPERWRERLGEAGLTQWRRQGWLPFYHYAVERELPLGVQFLDSCLALPGIPGPAGVPVAIVHGRHDDTVDWRHAFDYATTHRDVEFHLVEGDHRLTDPRHEELIAWCARDLMGRKKV